MFIRSVVNWRVLQSPSILQSVNCHKFPLKSSRRLISLFRRRPLYKPTNAIGRAYLRLRNFTLGIATISVATFSVFYLLDARSSVHRYVFAPALRLIASDPEDAHRIALLALKYGIHPKDMKQDDPRLAVEVIRFESIAHFRYGADNSQIPLVLRRVLINKPKLSTLYSTLDFHMLRLAQ
jgi:hypothetical protein